MFKSFVGCLAALIIYDTVKKKWNELYHWKCDQCNFKIINNSAERGAEIAYNHIQEEHPTSSY